MGVLKNRRLITAYPDPDAPYRVSILIDKGYRYASTGPATVDPETGKRKYHRIHWGTVEDGNRFVPGNTYLFSPVEERTKLIFPDGWDLSEIEKLSGNRKPGRPVIESQDENRLYGDMLKAQHHYKLRDEQEKYFSMMKGIMGADRQRNWSESGMTGRLFILFV